MITQPRDYRDGHFEPDVFYVMRNRICGYFSKVLKKCRSEIEIKISTQKFVLRYFYQFFQVTIVSLK